MADKVAIELARRAIWAMLQDSIVGLEMVDDLDAHVDRAIRIALETKSDEEAIDMAEKTNK